MIDTRTVSGTSHELIRKSKGGAVTALDEYTKEQDAELERHRVERERIVYLLNEAQRALHYNRETCDMLQALKACVWNTSLDLLHAYHVERNAGIARRGGRMDATSRVASVLGTLTSEELRAQYKAFEEKRWNDEPLGADKMSSLYEDDGLLRKDIHYEFMQQAAAKLERLTKQGL